MSAIFAIAGGAPVSTQALDGAVAEMGSRGAERIESRSVAGAGLAAGRFGWEVAETSPGPIVLDDGVRIVVADASLYYRDTLASGIRQASHGGQIEIGGDSASHLILAAYRAWGIDCARHLEGEFAFALWDRETQTLVCARDFVGGRPLYFGRSGDAVVVGSLASAVARRTAHGGALDVAAIGESLAGLFNVGDATSYLGVSVLATGHTLVRNHSGALTITPHWDAPVVDDSRASSFEEGAEELRELLTDAVDERLPDGLTTALWLSGGWDSSAILACATRALARRDGGRKLALVSMSYPEGNLGREDEAIHSVAERFGRSVSWCQSTDVPLLPPDAVASATQRDLPFAHAFEMWSRAMAAKSLEQGARVSLTGTGGDELFSGSNLYLSDLLRSGAWVTLAMEWYRMRGRTLEGFSKRVVRPAFAGSRADKELDRGGPFEQSILAWIKPEFVRAHQLRERERAAAPYGRYRSLSATEMHWGISAPIFARIRSTLGAVQLRAGVLPRSPLLDGRLLRFAMSRPRQERVSARETKRLLRHAMKGLLPDDFLAPRPRRTGVTTQYMRDEMQGPAREPVSAVFERPVLAELGIIDADVLRREWQRFLDVGDTFGLRFFELYQTELWVRARLAAGSAGSLAREPISAASDPVHN
ncbi:MAG: asparagine synthase-related protein [Gemmatimonadaceae bacterium]